MAHMNSMSLHQDIFQDIQDFCNQNISMKKVCNELGLNFRRCKDHAMAILKDEDVTEPSQQQIIRSFDKLEEEHHAIMFMCKADRQKYGDFLE